jgi:hypothetical protein
VRLVGYLKINIFICSVSSTFLGKWLVTSGFYQCTPTILLIATGNLLIEDYQFIFSLVISTDVS